MVGQGRRALLGRIAEFGWFMQQGEPAATQALAMLLEDEPLRDPQPCRPAPCAVEDIADEVGDLDHFGMVTPLAAIRGDRRGPGMCGDVDQDFGDVDGELMTDHEAHLAGLAVLHEAV